MSDQNINDTAYGVTKAVLESEAVSNLTNPPTKVAGGLLADFINLTVGGIHYASIKAELKRQKKFEDFKANIQKGVDNIPTEHKVESRESIIGPALEKAKYFMNEDEIREMFEKLIVNSFDSRKIEKIHPSFSDIIQQMSPIDAQNLKCFSVGENLPICEIRINFEKSGHRILQTNIFCSNKFCNSIEQQSISLSSLSRMGLISIAYDEYITDDSVYKIFDSLPIVVDFKNQIEAANKSNNSNQKFDLQKGVAKLTPVGKAFIDVCLRPLPT
ncbi:DUF4393 domain-containing protein [Ruminococcus sp.]|uniref:DUF4393 domain-containing protein n=1 Tax=Ruminococcus sp. TaxID=41978 RepID=UPI0025F96FAB|nr:DUF4393 domain-containing protein [Ruminococcus sp.]